MNAWPASVKDLLGVVNGFHTTGGERGQVRTTPGQVPDWGLGLQRWRRNLYFSAHLSSWYEIYMRHICGTPRD